MRLEELLRIHLQEKIKEMSTKTICSEWSKNALRAALASLEYEKKKKGKTALTEEEEITVLQREIKKYKDALPQLLDRSEKLHEQYTYEMKVLEAYVPSQLTEDEVKAMISRIIISTNTFGGCMKILSTQIRGRFDGKRAAELVQKALNSSI